MSAAVQPLTTIGHVTPRVDAMARVTGQAKYTNDIKLPGMLYARVLRSPHPHARILRIDTSEASRLPGVQAVITHETAHVVWGAGAVAGGRQYNDASRRRRCNGAISLIIRCVVVGDAVAAVAATDRHIAEQALALIRFTTRCSPLSWNPKQPWPPCATDLAGRESVS